MQDMCMKGDLPWEAEITSMPIGNWHHLEIRPAPSVFGYVCKTESPLAFPKDTPNRQHERLIGQPSLFEYVDDNIVPLSEVMSDADAKSVWMTYGLTDKARLSHLCWNLPSAATENEQWLAHLNVMARIERMGKERPEARPADPTAAIKFRQAIDDALNRKDEGASDTRN